MCSGWDMLHYPILNRFCYKIQDHLFNHVLAFYDVLVLENKCCCLIKMSTKHWASITSPVRKYEIVISKTAPNRKITESFLYL